jgi:hypothetical protein
VGANYLAQVPYYLDVYYWPHHVAPNLSGALLLGATFVWFLVGYIMLARGIRPGYWLLLSFLLVEVCFYLYNMLNQVAHGYPPFLHLVARDAILTSVFDIGYLNLLCGLYFLYYLVRHHRALIDSHSAAFQATRCA